MKRGGNRLLAVDRGSRRHQAAAREKANACAERLQPRPDRTSPADRPGWCTSGLSAGYAPSKRSSERSLPVASGRMPGADSPVHLLAIALISTSCTALCRQGRALHGVACAVGRLCRTREQIIHRRLIAVSDTAGKADETIVGFENRFAPRYLYLQLRQKNIWRSMNSIGNISRPAARRCQF